MTGSKSAWLALAATVLAIPLVGLWWVTAGDFHLLQPLNFGNVYEAQLRSFEAGRADIPCDIATGEAFVRDGKCYVYFGPVPALVRKPLLWADPTLDGRMTRARVLVANLLFLAAVGLILAEAGHPPGTWPFTGYLLLTAFGSTMPWMWSWPTTWVEAISWALAFSAASLYCLLKGANAGNQSAGWLLGASLLAMLAFFTRLSTGAGPMLAVGLVSLWQWRSGRGRWAPAIALVLLLASAGGFAANNRARMGTYWNAVPIHLHVAYHPERLARIGGALFHPEKSLPILVDYLLEPPRFRPSYPWLEFRSRALFNIAGMDFVDLHTGVLPMMPALAWLAWAGWRAKRGTRVMWLLLSPLLGLVLLVTVAAIAQRYVHEFLLLLAPAGAFGLQWAVASKPRVWILMTLSVWSVYAGWATALVGQREVMYWIGEEALERHRAIRYGIDVSLWGMPDSPAAFDYLRGDPPAAVGAGRVRVVQTGSEYVFDGAKWRLRSGPPVHRFQVPVRFSVLPGERFTLLSAGRTPDIDMISLERAPTGRYRLRMDHGGTDRLLGAELDLVTGRDYLFDCELDRLNGEMRISLDGLVVGTRKAALWPWPESDVKTASRENP